MLIICWPRLHFPLRLPLSQRQDLSTVMIKCSSILIKVWMFLMSEDLHCPWPQFGQKLREFTFVSFLKNSKWRAKIHRSVLVDIPKALFLIIVITLIISWHFNCFLTLSVEVLKQFPIHVLMCLFSSLSDSLEDERSLLLLGLSFHFSLSRSLTHTHTHTQWAWQAFRFHWILIVLLVSLFWSWG